MSSPALSPHAPLVQRVGAYLDERFPVGAYGTLVAVFSASAMLCAWGLQGELSRPAHLWLRGAAAGLVVLLAFFHIRVFDEHKDAVGDRRAHPERLLSRGVVTLGLLARLGALAVVLQALLAGALGLPALLAWLAVFAFTLLMRVEFFVGAWLQRRLLLYALSHNPVVALLALFLWAASGAPWDWAFLALAAFASLSMLGFELARKLHLPEEEHPEVPSYSSVLGRPLALGLLLGSLLLASGAAGLLLGSLAEAGPSGVGWPWLDLAGMLLVVGGLLAPLVLVRPRAPGKRLELASTLNLLLTFLGIALAAA